MYQCNYFGKHLKNQSIVIVTRRIRRAALLLTLGASGFIIDDSVGAFGKGDNKLGATNESIINVCNNNQGICYFVIGKEKIHTDKEDGWIDCFLLFVFVSRVSYCCIKYMIIDVCCLFSYIVHSKVCFVNVIIDV